MVLVMHDIICCLARFVLVQASLLLYFRDTYACTRYLRDVRHLWWEPPLSYYT
jgi:hypothetical protein